LRTALSYKPKVRLAENPARVSPHAARPSVAWILATRINVPRRNPAHEPSDMRVGRPLPTCADRFGLARSLEDQRRPAERSPAPVPLGPGGQPRTLLPASPEGRRCSTRGPVTARPARFAGAGAGAGNLRWRSPGVTSPRRPCEWNGPWPMSRVRWRTPRAGCDGW
jgi:hypothetical protein